MSRNGIVRNGRSASNGAGRNGHACRELDISPGLLVSVAGVDHELEPEDLLNDELIGELRSSIDDADGAVRFTINNLLAWSDETRWSLLSMIATLDYPLEVWLPDHDAGFPDLFQAVLFALEGNADIERCERGKRAAIEAAILVHPQSLDIASSKIADRFKELGVRGILPQKILKQARAIAGQEEGSRN